jgi:hypothetical protein
MDSEWSNRLAARWSSRVMGRVGVVLLATALATGAVPAAAQVAGSEYATWTSGGADGDFTGTMTLPPAFPQATWTSNSRAPIAIPGGASNWLPDWTPFGAVYGSSQNNPYLNLRPAADSADSPSTTTFTFASPTPPAGWGFVVGDIDADMVEVSATDVDGNPVPGAALGFQDAFNYCEMTPRPSSCVLPTPPDPFDVPTVTVGGNSVAVVGNVADTTGAAASFQPTVPLATLTFEFTWQAGFPIYHLWLATLTRFVSGTVTVDGTPGLGGVELTLTDANGAVVATTVTADDGTYFFDGLGPGEDYVVTMATPVGFEAVGPESLSVDLVSDNATGIDFDLTQPPETTTTTSTTTTTTTTTVVTEPTGSITAVVAVEDEPPDEDWELTVDSPNCDLGGPLTETVPAEGGTAVFAELPVFSDEEVCSYDLTQPPREGWDVDDVIGIVLDENLAVTVTVTQVRTQPDTTTSTTTTVASTTTTTTGLTLPATGHRVPGRSSSWGLVALLALVTGGLLVRIAQRRP